MNENTNVQTTNKKKVNKLLLLLLLLLIGTSGVLLSTLARYAGNFEGTATARVAVFDVGVDTVFDIDLLDSDFSSEETDVWNNQNGGKAVIAPGTSGEFTIAVENKSEVTIDASRVTLSVDDLAIPVQFSSDGITWSFPDDTTKELTLAYTTELGTMGKEDTETVSVYWRWAYQATGTPAEVEARDVADTALGKAAATGDVDLEIEVNIYCVQVD